MVTVSLGRNADFCLTTGACTGRAVGAGAAEELTEGPAVVEVDSLTNERLAVVCGRGAAGRWAGAACGASSGM